MRPTGVVPPTDPTGMDPKGMDRVGRRLIPILPYAPSRIVKTPQSGQPEVSCSCCLDVRTMPLLCTAHAGMSLCALKMEVGRTLLK